MLLCSSTLSMAQSTLIATLSHSGQVKAFYGASALNSAHAAAVDGDVITLSSGTFTSCNITKAITLRGAGMVSNPATQTFPTYISGDFNISTYNTSKRILMEGLNCEGEIGYVSSIEQPVFQKCIFNKLVSKSSAGNLVNATFINCHIRVALALVDTGSATLINCYLSDPGYPGYGVENTRLDVQNCVIRICNTNINGARKSSFSNCVIVYGRENALPGKFNASNTVLNCVYTGTSDNIFENITNGNNKVIPDVNNVMKEFTGYNYAYDRSFALTETAAKTYLGTDGTQVGMYGGMLPFDPIPNSLQITKCNVAGKSTVDGKLSVDIEVSGIK